MRIGLKRFQWYALGALWLLSYLTVVWASSEIFPVSAWSFSLVGLSAFLAGLSIGIGMRSDS